MIYGVIPKYDKIYGDRIFVLKRDETADKILKPLSVWNGADKDRDKSLGYEFSEENFLVAVKQLQEAGFTRESINNFI